MFQDILIKRGIEPYIYLDIVRDRANNQGYNPSLLHFSNDEKKKLNYAGVDFGASNYKDYIIYALTEPEKATRKRENYWKRAEKVARDTRDMLSPANLSLRILW